VLLLEEKTEEDTGWNQQAKILSQLPKGFLFSQSAEDNASPNNKLSV
jgi:hypothetical protein